LVNDDEIWISLGDEGVINQEHDAHCLSGYQRSTYDSMKDSIHVFLGLPDVMESI